MKNSTKLLILLGLLLINAPSQTFAFEEKSVANLYPEEKSVFTQHKLKIDGKTISYQAEAGNTFIKNDKEEKIGSIFYVAYTKQGTKLGDRPITFSFNGGPGSASVWLHMGALGPKRVLMTKEGFATKPPYKLVDNQYSLLDETDIVFIDPVGTGYSRVDGTGKDEDFHGVWEDVESVSEFIRLYLTRNKRWPSPKYLIGESYGTTRSAGIAYHMGQNKGVYFNGIMLISSILNFTLEEFGYKMSPLPSMTMLPSYTATAWYHKKLSPELQKDLKAAIEQAKEFALNDYALALLKGDKLSHKRRKSIAKRLSQLTGISTQVLLENQLKLPLNTFLHNLDRDNGLTFGRLDSRFKTQELDALNKAGYRDPSYMAIHGSYTQAMMQYLAEDLNYQSDKEYFILGGGVKSWNYKEFAEQLKSDISGKLKDTMLRNPDMQVFVGNGYYDLATPFFATEYTFDHMHLPPQVKNNVSMEYYESGHMMYVREQDLIKLKKDLAQFIQNSK